MISLNIHYRVYATLIAVFMLISLAQAQGDSLMQIMERGIELHDQSKYELSLVEYKKALELEPKSAFVNYETALSYYYLGEKAMAEKHAKIAAKEKSEIGLESLILLGSLYDEQGNPKKSIKVYKNATKDYGDYYLLWFNMGVTANGMRDYELAAKAFENAANNRLDHANSHYALGTVMQVQGRRAEAMLPMYFFLLLEPDSERSQQAYATLNDLWSKGVKMNPASQDVEISLEMPEKGASESFRGADMMISMLEASQSLEQNADKTEFELYRNKLISLFKFLKEADNEGREDFYTRYYIPFFARIAESDYMDTFVHYIRQSTNEESRKWVNEHTDDLVSFFDWLDTKETELDE